MSNNIKKDIKKQIALALFILISLYLNFHQFRTNQQLELERLNQAASIKESHTFHKNSELLNVECEQPTNINKSEDNATESESFPQKDVEALEQLSESQVETQHDNSVELPDERPFIPFDEQEIDYEWAAKVESSVHDVFTNQSYLSEYMMDEVICRSSTCKIFVSNVEGDSFNVLLSATFAFKENKIFSESTHGIRGPNRLKDGRVMLYVDRYEGNLNDREF